MKSKIDEAIIHNMLDLHKQWLFEQVDTNYKISKGKRFEILDSELSDFRTNDQNFSNSIIIRCIIKNSLFIKCDFSATLFFNSVFKSCKFDNCNFYKTELNDADGSASDFIECDFTRADLTGCKMVRTNFKGCDFSWAWFDNADMRNTNLKGIKLNGTRIYNSKFYNKHKFEFLYADKATIKGIDFDPKGEGGNVEDSLTLIQSNNTNGL